MLEMIKPLMAQLLKLGWNSQRQIKKEDRKHNKNGEKHKEKGIWGKTE